MSQFKLTIVTVNLNNSDGLRKTLQSIASQEGTLPEVVVIDGGSTDGSLDTIQEFSQLGVVSYFKSDSDDGIYDAMNQGIHVASGDFILFLNSGDSLFGTNALNTLRDFVINNVADIYFADAIVSETGESISYLDRIDRKFLFFNSLCHQSIVYKSTVFTTTGLYDISFKILADREHLYRAYMKGITFMHMNFPLVNWEKSGFSSKNIDKLVNEIKRFHDLNYSIAEQFLMKLVRKMEILFKKNG